MPPGRESRLKFNREKRLADKIRADKALQKATEQAKKKAGGKEVVARATLKPTKPDTEN